MSIQAIFGTWLVLCSGSRQLFGVYITLEEPTRDMTTEALKAGFYHSPGWNKDYPRIQILTIEELLHNAEVKMPPQFGTFKQAQRAQPTADAEQFKLGFG